jgi:hypothetical protein
VRWECNAGRAVRADIVFLSGRVAGSHVMDPGESAPDNANPTCADGAAWGRWRVGRPGLRPANLDGRMEPMCIRQVIRLAVSREVMICTRRPTVAGQRRLRTGFP